MKNTPLITLGLTLLALSFSACGQDFVPAPQNIVDKNEPAEMETAKFPREFPAELDNRVPGRPDCILPPYESPTNCTLEPSWTQTHDPGFTMSRFFQVSPNGALVFAHGDDAQVYAYSGLTGEPLFQVEEPWYLLNVDAELRVKAEFVYTEANKELVVSPVLEGDALWSLALDNAHNHEVMISADGNRVILFSCESEPMQTTVQSFVAATGDLDNELVIPNVCYHNWPLGNDQMQVSKDGTQILFAGLYESSVLVFADLEYDIVHKIDISEVLEEISDEDLEIDQSESAPFDDYFVSVALSPWKTRFAAVTSRGVIKHWAVQPFTLLSSTWLTQVNRIDNISYMPSLAAPMTFSYLRTQFAYVNTEGQLEVVDLQNNNVLFTGPLPEELELDAPSSMGNRGNETLNLRFLNDGSGVVGSFTHGLTLWRCNEFEMPEEEEELPVTLEGPHQVTVGTTVEYIATHLGTNSIHGHLFTIDGEPLGPASSHRGISWTPEEVGTFELAVEVIDGFHTGTHSFWVTVTED